MRFDCAFVSWWRNCCRLCLGRNIKEDGSSVNPYPQKLTNFSKLNSNAAGIRARAGYVIARINAQALVPGPRPQKLFRPPAQR